MNSHRGVKAQKSILDSDFDKHSLNSRNSNNERIKSMLQVHNNQNSIETKPNTAITKKLSRQIKKQLTQKRQIEINRE